jgi:hypothetical protein
MNFQFLLVHTHGGTIIELIPLLSHATPYQMRCLTSLEWTSYHPLRMKTHFDYLSLSSPPLPHHRFGSILTNRTSHLLLGHTITQRDPWISCGQASKLYFPLGLVSHDFLLAKTLEFGTSSPIIVPLLYEIRMFKRLHHVYMSGLQLFNIA